MSTRSTTPTSSIKPSVRLGVVVALFCAVLGFTAGAQAQAPNSHLLSFGTIEMAFTQTPTPELQQDLESRVHAYFSGPATQPSIEAGLTTLVQRMSAQGYRHARIAPTDFNVAGDQLQFTLTIAPGPRSYIREVAFTGAASTDTAWLSQVTAIPVGVPLTDAWLDDALDRLDQVSYLRCAAPPTIDVVHVDPPRGTEDVRVSFALTEAAPSQFDGLVAANGQGEQTALTGRASLEFGGLFGRDRTVAVHFERPRPEWRTFNINYHENGALYAPLSWSVELDELTRNHRRQTVRTDFAYLIPQHRRWTVGLGGMWRRVTPNGSTVTPARISELSMSVQRSTPHRARTRNVDASLSLDAAYSHRRSLGVGTEDRSESRLKVTQRTDIAIPVTHTWRLEFVSAGYWWPVGADAVGPGDEWYLGGADMLRGYEQQWFAATSGVWTALELERTLSPQLRFSTFAEAARLELFDREDPDWPYSYGWAVSLHSLQRVGRLEFAWGRGVALRDGIVRLRITQSW